VLLQLPDKVRHRVELDVETSVFAKKVQEMTSSWLSRTEKVETRMAADSASDWGMQTMELWRLTGQAKLNSVKEYLKDLLGNSNNPDLKCILFAHHKFMIEGLEELLVKTLPPGGYMRIDGGVDSSKRALLVEQFQNDATCRVALLSITSCSEGITLTAASLVIFCEMYWVPGLIEQAEARAHRVGQKDCVVCYYLVMPDSPDDVIFNMLEKKKKDTSVILDGREIGLIEEVRHELTDAELLEIAEQLDDNGRNKRIKR
jgi:SNF2 family DNA or RNA helicase